MNIRLSVSGRIAHDGPVAPSTLHVIGPGARVEWLFRDAHDALHLQISNALISECAHATLGRGQDLARDVVLLKDPVTEKLGLALLASGQLGGAFGQSYVDCLGGAIVSRMLALRSAAAQPERLPSAGMQKWRLKRALDFIDSHLGERIGSAEIAAAAGQTRMHFAGQFRVTTGLRPHEYLLRRRVERAQEMLLHDDLPVVEVALEVGFQSQAHFTSVFKRFVGLPPCTWRRSLDAGF